MPSVAAVLTFKSDDVEKQNAHYMGNTFRARALLRSIEKFAPDAFAEILIICPKDDFNNVNNLRDGIKLNIKVVDEAAILPPREVLISVPSWYRQQICKLTSYTLTKCEAILQLDPDMIIRRPTVRSDFFVAGRLLTQLESTNNRPERWTGAAELLRFTHEIPAFGLSVTPALLSAEICSELANRLAQLYGVPAPVALANNAPRGWKRTWTEYACYTLFAIDAGLWSTHHFLDRRPPNAAAMFASRNVWNPNDAMNLSASDIFNEDDPGIFFVFQSATGISYRDYISLIGSEISV